MSATRVLYNKQFKFGFITKKREESVSVGYIALCS